MIKSGEAASVFANGVTTVDRLDAHDRTQLFKQLAKGFPNSRIIINDENGRHICISDEPERSAGRVGAVHRI
jgi:hypothetical protein